MLLRALQSLGVELHLKSSQDSTAADELRAIVNAKPRERT